MGGNDEKRENIKNMTVYKCISQYWNGNKNLDSFFKFVLDILYSIEKLLIIPSSSK